ncbi:MAG: alpha/beta fold hydrolase [Rhodospirillales bacterium]|nr:alpha/beta fold hydrolase [Rhodospirillales bacterium]
MDHSSTGQPGPMLRRGPRPLALHLSLAMLRSSASLGGLPHWKNASPPSAPEAIFRALAAGLAGGGAGPAAAEADPAAFAAALGTELFAQDAALIAGIAAYRRHPYRRVLADPPVLWQEGGTVLRDYAPGGRGLPLFFVPSLINRAYILDLNAERSLLRHLTAAGYRPLLLDWGWPGAVERGFTLTDYVAGRLARALRAAAAAMGGPLVLAGYCMGGTLAVAAAGLAPDLVRALVLLAAPWDFHADSPERAAQLAAMLPLMEPALAFAETLPVDLLQMLFTLLDPFGVGEKYRAFAALDPAGARAALFVALEDWLNDGVPLAAPVAREALGGWYGANSPAGGSWRIAGLPVDPTALAMPCFVAAPLRDRIVPPASARPLARLIAGAVLHEPAAGHIGMVAGSNAPAALWQPLTAWLATQAGPGRRGRRGKAAGARRG